MTCSLPLSLAALSLLLLNVLPASAAAASTVNLTVYRITPRNYTGVSNLDTGDAAGDAFFGLYEKSAPVVCRDAKSGDNSNLLCSNEPILQIAGFNVYIAVTVEADSRFGDYAECNPDAHTGVFACAHHHHGGFGPTECWYNSTSNPQWKSQFADECSMSHCKCDAVEVFSVGVEYPRFGAHIPAGTPKHCASNFYPIPHMSYDGSPAYRTLKASLDDCCSACTSDNAHNKPCELYTRSFWGECSLYTNVSFSNLKPSVGSSSGYFSGAGISAYVQRAAGQLSEIMNGTWYSTQRKGQCTDPSQVIGKDCWWREVEQTRMINATCVNDNMIKVVEARQPACFKACPDPEDHTSDCWIECLFETIVGNSTKTPALPATPKDVIVRAFEQSFESDDPAKGGCADVPPCPEPCLPPCWAVPKGAPCTP